MQASVSATMARRISSTGPPVERSMRASAPYFTAARAFSSSLAMSMSSAEVPMLALTLVRRPFPTARGRPFFRLMLRQTTMVPAAIPSRMNSGLTPSARAASFIVSVMIPCRAYSSWVTVNSL